MRQGWFSDNRDIVKWGVLLRLAERYDAAAILQVAYYRPGPKAYSIEIDDQVQKLPEAVLEAFRNVKDAETIRSSAKIIVMDDPWQNRETYLASVLGRIRILPRPSVVFLDPDTGLEPEKTSNLTHILNAELSAIWQALRPKDVLVLYQHRTNRSGKPWIPEKKAQFERAIGCPRGNAHVGHGSIARDVAFMFHMRED